MGACCAHYATVRSCGGATGKKKEKDRGRPPALPLLSCSVALSPLQRFIALSRPPALSCVPGLVCHTVGHRSPASPSLGSYSAPTPPPPTAATQTSDTLPARAAQQPGVRGQLQARRPYAVRRLRPRFSLIAIQNPGDTREMNFNWSGKQSLSTGVGL